MSNKIAENGSWAQQDTQEALEANGIEASGAEVVAVGNGVVT